MEADDHLHALPPAEGLSFSSSGKGRRAGRLLLRVGRFSLFAGGRIFFGLVLGGFLFG